MTKFYYCESTNTIRTMPENYLVAHKANGRWTVGDCDKALPTELAVKVFITLHENVHLTWGTGQQLLATIMLEEDAA